MIVDMKKEKIFVLDSCKIPDRNYGRILSFETTVSGPVLFFFKVKLVFQLLFSINFECFVYNEKKTPHRLKLRFEFVF